MYDFTKRRFLELSHTQQNKKCAEVIKDIYTSQESDRERKIDYYNQLMTWLNKDCITVFGLQTISDRYHDHLKEAQIAKKEHHLLPTIRTGDKCEGEQSYPIHIYLDNLRSAHNVGSIIRTVEAMRLGYLYFSAKTPFIDHKQVQATSMGAYEWISCFNDVSLEDLPKPIIALETSKNAISLYDFIFPDEFTLVLGNEEYGCSEGSLKAAEIILEIPMRGRKNSLNVANAFAIVASEIVRQKER